MAHVVITYYSDGTEQVQGCGESEESANVEFMLQTDAMKDGQAGIERVQVALIVKDTE